ncbi:MAG: alpha/beta hydrolase [Bacteroidota bacterium]
MKYHSLIISALVAISFSLNACYLDQDIEGQFSDEFYLRNAGADLPVWVRGSNTAETFIIFLHGGPFDTAIENAVYEHFAPLYDEYAMVFFDQRGGGYSHGQRAVGLTEEQFVEDVEVVVSLVKEKYPQAQNLFLMGHSYGGYLGTAFLKTDRNQDNFDGWIELAGAHNFNFNWLASRDFSIKYLEKRLSESPENREEYEERLQVLKDTPAVTNLNELFTINGIAFWIAQELNAGKSQFENPSALHLLSSPVGAGFSQQSLGELEDLLVNGNQNPDMPSITLPSLLIYGAEDPIVPVATGQNGMEFLGTPDPDKSLLVLEESGHNIWEYEIDLFFDAVRSFIKQYE